MSLQQVINFLNQYSLTYIDQQTSIISNNPNNNPQNPTSQNQTKTQQSCYLLKDMLIPQNQQNPKETENNLTNILDTLKLHKALNNKYILTLLHYQVFMKNVNIPLSTNPQTQQLSNSTSRRNSYPKNHLNKSNLHKDKNTQLYDTNSIIDSQQELQQQSHEFSQQIQITTSIPQRAIRAIYQYTPLTLQQEIQNRKSSNTNFQQQQLWAIMATITRALTYLQSQNIIYGVLGTDKVFITNSLVKILDPSATATDPLLVQQGRLYSPQILNHHQNSQEIDMFKSDIYILGLIILQCGLLIDLTKQIQQNLNKYLIHFKNIYSEQLIHILQQCLTNLPQDRPSFEELQQYLTRQLDMNDFSHAYQNGIQQNHQNYQSTFNPLENDIEDLENQIPIQIEIQNKNVQFTYDVLYQRQDQHKSVKIRNNTPFQRAKNKFLHTKQYQNLQIESPTDSSSQQEIPIQQKIPIRCGSPHNPLRPQSPKLHQTKRNIPKATATYTTSTFKSKSKQPYLYPSINSINAKISQSVYGEQLPIHHNGIQNLKNKDINFSVQSKKNFTNSTEIYLQNKFKNNHQKSKQNLKIDKNFQQKIIPKQINLQNMQKIKKTKLIKQKLIKNHQNFYHQHSFGKKYQNTLTQNHFIINKTKSPQNSLKKHTQNLQKFTQKNIEKQYFKYDHTGDSIQQELQEQSQNSCLYNYNTNPNKNSKFSNSNNNLRSSISQSIKSAISAEQPTPNSIPIGSTKSSKISLINQNQPETNKFNIPILNKQKQRDLFMTDNQHLFTHPNLMKTIKEDLEIYNKARR